MSLAALPRGVEWCPHFGKAIFGRAQAKRVARRDARRTGLNIQPYQCRTCGGWHVGNKRFG